MWEPDYENRIWESTLIIYARTNLFENRVNVKNLNILITWSVLTSKIYILKNQSDSHNIM
jgi:hypothetical protein